MSSPSWKGSDGSEAHEVTLHLQSRCKVLLLVSVKFHSSGISGKKRAQKEFVDGILLLAGIMREKGIWRGQSESGSTANEVNVHDHGAVWICHGKIMFSKKLDVRPFLCLSVAEVEIMMLCLCLKPQEQMPLCSRKGTDFWETAVQCFIALPIVQ